VQFSVDDFGAGRRLDQFLHEQLAEYSRARIQDWIKSGRVLVNRAAARASQGLRAGDTIEVEPAELPPLKARAEDIPLRVLYEDAAVIAIDKPAGMVVHAGAGIHSGTLVNALLHRFDSLSQIGGELRPGLVHRLDRFTSGVLLVAKTDAAHQDLARQFSSREVEKVYLALVQGRVKNDTGRIDRPISRDPVRRTRMTARLGEGRSAWTEYRVLRRHEKFSYLEVHIGTGRTHQIRVHLASIGYPVVGDTLYGARSEPALGGRFFLHAHRIRFRSPATKEEVTIESPLPLDLQGYMGDEEAGSTGQTGDRRLRPPGE
jgi:23S rRNA pseudouridine1911/1915/1917 synthase